MKIITILGTRPEIIKLSPLLPLLEKEFEHVLVHTGQHYSWEMDKIFFDELQLRPPQYNLNVGSAAQGEQTGRMVQEIEKILHKEKPSGVITFGDTNSTLAGAIAASKFPCILVHIEAGARSKNKKQPEEINRILADHCADFLFVIDEECRSNLVREGHDAQKIFVVGNIVEESCARTLALMNNEKKKELSREGQDEIKQERKKIIVTVHRSENTDNANNLKEIVKAINALAENYELIFPAHPRTKKAIEQEKIEISPQVQEKEPLGYGCFLQHLAEASLVITDSGGVYEEAAFLNVPVLIAREHVELHDAIKKGKASLVGANAEKILHAAKEKLAIPKKVMPRHPSEKISENITTILKKIFHQKTS